MITGNSFLKVSCHTKFRFAEREAQCILVECGPLKHTHVSSNRNSSMETKKMSEYHRLGLPTFYYQQMNNIFSAIATNLAI